MKNKYYTPTVEEFHVEFEYEEKDGPNWIKRITHKDFLFEAEVMSDEIREGLIRVKYLDKEDIISLGFENIKIDSKTNISYIKEYKGIRDYTHIQITTNDINNHILISVGKEKTSYFSYDTLFAGIIKNKSELIQILKMVGYGL